MRNLLATAAGATTMLTATACEPTGAEMPTAAVAAEHIKTEVAERFPEATIGTTVMMREMRTPPLGRAVKGSGTDQYRFVVAVKQPRAADWRLTTGHFDWRGSDTLAVSGALYNDRFPVSLGKVPGNLFDKSWKKSQDDRITAQVNGETGSITLSRAETDLHRGKPIMVVTGTRAFSENLNPINSLKP